MEDKVLTRTNSTRVLHPLACMPHGRLAMPSCPTSPCSKPASEGRVAEFRLGATLGALGRTAQGLLESALEGPAK